MKWDEKDLGYWKDLLERFEPVYKDVFAGYGLTKAEALQIFCMEAKMDFMVVTLENCQSLLESIDAGMGVEFEDEDEEIKEPWLEEHERVIVKDPDWFRQIMDGPTYDG